MSIMNYSVSVEFSRWQWSRRGAGIATTTIPTAAAKSRISARWIGPGGLRYRTAGSIRDTIARSVDHLPRRDRVLVTGFVYGDDRGQLPQVVDDFRATGLTHLVAVSGSNVALVLTMFGPVLRRLGGLWRLVAVVAILSQFALVTRGEPSVLRACVLAVVATGATVVGRPSSRLRLLAIAVADTVWLAVRSVRAPPNPQTRTP